MAIFKYGSLKLFYEFKGEGTPILVVHGMLSSHKRMEPFAKSLRDSGFSTVCIDLPFHGKSKGFVLTTQAFLTAVEKLLSSLKIGEYHCLGFSLGSLICSALSRTDPRVDSLFVVSPVISDLRPLRFIMTQALSGARSRKSYREFLIDLFMSLGGPSYSRDSARSRVDQATHTDLKTFLQDIALGLQINCGVNLKYSDKPLMAAVGKHDPLVLPEEIRRFLPKGAKLRVLPSGHSDIHPNHFMKDGKNWMAEFFKSVEQSSQ